MARAPRKKPEPRVKALKNKEATKKSASVKKVEIDISLAATRKRYQYANEVLMTLLELEKQPKGSIGVQTLKAFHELAKRTREGFDNGWLWFSEVPEL